MLARHFLAATAMLCAVAMPGFLGIGAFAGLFVPTLVGPAWLEAVPVVQVLAFGAASGFAAALCFPLLWAVGRPALGLAPRAAELVVALVLLLALEAGGPAMAAYAWAARQVVEVGFAVLICPRVLPLRVGALPGAVAVPAGLAAGAVLGLLALRQVALAGLPPVAQLALLGGAGAVLTVVAAGIVQPALARAALGRIWPRRG
jgi:O-antigen/teichoic acid export membrane protein